MLVFRLVSWQMLRHYVDPTTMAKMYTQMRCPYQANAGQSSDKWMVATGRIDISVPQAGCYYKLCDMRS